ncbi:MAG: undecaprenyldiphospho-muramoylpentapeptide beta-N-acetylglucosaminyltransferase [Lachnospiraceae bacterium]|nr:undecaprenyldiphospho-muramoylpentapeptide beta-N-acetylglucosaminyltransferase [Lachnospiraceae bacterium]
MKKIVLTGGGTAGHCVPNLALLPTLKAAGFDISYIGSYKGIERSLAEGAGLVYYGVSSGKLRRYMDIKNFTDPFRVIKGYAEAVGILKKLSPDVVFSKGGFVAVPVVRAAKHLKIPVICHESDMTPGLANRLSFGAAKKICCSFRETLEQLPAEKGVFTGSPVRSELFEGNRERALKFSGLTDDGRPFVLIVGGSLGAAHVNEAVRHALPGLLTHYQVVHLCGRGKVDPTLNQKDGYVQYDYIDREMADLLALADVVISRAGSNAIFELLALKKPNILVPLPAGASRGDQILNARSFAARGYSFVLQDEDLSDETLLSALKAVLDDKDIYIDAMKKSPEADAVSTICGLIEAVSSGKN